MGQAVLSSIYQAPKANEENTKLYPSKIITCNHNEDSSKAVGDFVEKLGPSPNGIIVECTFGENSKVVPEADVFILGTKPYLVQPVLEPIQEHLEGKLLISLAAGITIDSLQTFSTSDTISRVMTNTPAKYGYGTAVVAHSPSVNVHNKLLVAELIGHVGKYIELPESKMDAATALVGSGPAFVLLMLESMMEAGLKMGIPLKESRECAIKVLEGTAKMVEISGEHPGFLKHQVCTPGGTTIAGLCVMEDKGVKSGIIRGIEEAAEVAMKLGKKKD